MKNTSPKLNKVMAAGSGAGVGEKLILSIPTPKIQCPFGETGAGDGNVAETSNLRVVAVPA
jgi:hypothetical protein